VTIGVNVTVSWLWGGSPRPVFFFFFRGEAAKKEEKRIFLRDAIPQTPALQSGKPLKLTHMPQVTPTACGGVVVVCGQATHHNYPTRTTWNLAAQRAQTS
jgi:hypothetical protein